MEDSKAKKTFAVNLSEYRKTKPDKLDPWTTSITLEVKHKKFLESENLNLSKLVRDFLDDLMERTSKK